MQYKQIFDILNSENVLRSLSIVKRIGQHFTKTDSTTRKMDSGCPKATRKRDDQQIKFAALRDRKKTLTNLTKEVQTDNGKTISKNYHNKKKKGENKRELY